MKLNAFGLLELLRNSTKNGTHGYLNVTVNGTYRAAPIPIPEHLADLSYPVAFAVVLGWLFCVGALPVLLRLSDGKPLTRIETGVGILHWTALLGGFYVFTNYITFQSPHFMEDEKRAVRGIECVYLMSQIFLSIGFGDFSPATDFGILFLSFFTIIAMLIVSTVVALAAASAVEATETYQTKLYNKMMSLLFEEEEEDLEPEVEDDTFNDAKTVQSEGEEVELMPEGPAMLPTLNALLFVMACAVLFVMFFVEFEEMSWIDSSYFMFGTLSTVGLGDVLTKSDWGMVFISAWCLIGCSAMFNLASEYIKLVMRAAKYEQWSNKGGRLAMQALMSSGTLSEIEFYRYGMTMQGCSEKDLKTISALYRKLGPGKDGRLHVSKLQHALTQVDAESLREIHSPRNSIWQ